MDSNMPTLRDVRDQQSIKGFTTMADIKNCFDCIPLHPADRKYAVAMTPLGLYRMNCQTYGWKNAAPNAQNITNRLCLSVGLTLAYIDDISIKHPFNYNTEQIIEHIIKLFEYCRLTNIKLDPTKFFPVADKSVGFSFSWELDGTRVSKSYTKKVLALAQPKTWKEMEHYLGVIGYIRNHIYNCSRLTYWLHELKYHCGVKGKIKWTKQGELAFNQIQHLVSKCTLLHHPTQDGEYCIQTDACNYGVGAVLFQKQIIGKCKEPQWVIIDMWSKVIPTQLRHCHSMVHEAYAVVGACEYWQFQLMKRKFIISTDNTPVANIFNKHKWYNISSITQKQLLRLRMTIDMFDYETYHVSGLNNQLADSLSRFTSKLIEMNDTKALIRAVNSRDTGNKPLTSEDEIYFDNYIKKCNQLTVKQRQLVHPNSVVNVLREQIHGEDMLEQSHVNILEARNDHWDNLLRSYVDGSTYIEKDRIQDLINSGREQSITSDEYALNDTAFTKLQGNIPTMINFISNLSQSTINTIMESFSTVTNDDSKVNNMVNIANDTGDSSVVSTDDDDSISNEEDDNTYTRERIQTRSQTQSNANKLITKTTQDIEFDRKRLRMTTRDEFMHDIFGHRAKLDIFDDDKLEQYQDNDNVLRIVKKLILNRQYKSRELDIEFVSKWEPQMMVKYNKNQLRLDEGILQAQTRTSSSDKMIWCDVIPFNLIGKVMDYYHHNLQLHHYGYTQTLQNIEIRYWWPTLRKDVKSFCDTCLTCQYTKGSVRHRAPLTVRGLPPRLTHIFADFIGPIYGKYYILVLIDYTTGYTMLIPTRGTDAITVIQSLLTKWIPILGWFKVFESDWGSGFNNKLLKLLLKSAGIHQELAEPRNHRSIGKVERIIGYVQRVLNQYNLQLDEYLTDRDIDYDQQWDVIEVILPFVQLAINQHRPRFTSFSPNMLIFGTNVNDISDIGSLQRKLIQVQELNKKNEDYKILSDLISRIKIINDQFETDWKAYTWLTIKNYNKRWSINDNKLKCNNKMFQKGSEILYYIGDKQVSQYKWKQRWTGPWIIDKRITDNTMIIGDPSTGNQKRVSIDRCKPFIRRDMIKYNEWVNEDTNYIDNENELIEMYMRYNADIRDQDFDLDFTNNNNMHRNATTKSTKYAHYGAQGETPKRDVD